MDIMKLFLAASPNPFDLKAALLQGHAQHPVIIHFPIALLIGSVAFEVMAAWRKQPVLASVAYYNLLGAALTVPLAIATSLGAWHWQLEGAAIKGNLRLHMIFAVTSALLIFFLAWMRSRLRAKGSSPSIAYWAVAVVTLLIITLTGHIGGILSGVETPV